MAAEVESTTKPLRLQDFDWRPWLLALLLALLWHAAWLLPKIPWQGVLPPPRVDIKTIDPAKIEAIRRKWDKQLLLNRDKSAPNEADNPDARFLSDRNRRVERETRARDTVTLPKPGGRASPGAQSQGGPRIPPKLDHFRELPKLGNLGIPLPIPQPRADSAAGEAPAQEEGGQQFMRDDSLPVGSENILNSQESIYYSFYARLYETIAPIWQSRIRQTPPRRVLAGDYTTIVDVVFDKDGTLVGVQRNQSSGVEEFDQAVNDAWRRIGRFPNPPKGLLDTQGLVHTGWSFTVRIQAGIPFDVLPPERNY